MDAAAVQQILFGIAIEAELVRIAEDDFVAVRRRPRRNR
jgi:hypothetical protein